LTERPDRTIAEAFADFAACVRPQDIPAKILEKAKLHILDTIGCALAGADSDFARNSLAALKQLGDGTGSTAIGQRDKLGLRDAIQFNAGLAHMLDFDDTHMPTLNHVSAGAAPLVLALGSQGNISGPDFLAAYLIAAEIGCRAGLGAKGPAFLHRGLHPTGVLNGFGASLAAGRLLALDTAGMAHAQGLALSFAAGTMEWQRDGAQAKRLHPGAAAVAGLTAAFYAKEGITGPRLPYEGRAGLYAIYLGADVPIDRGAMVQGLGGNWAFADVSVKPFPLVHHIHGVIDCAIRLRNEENLCTEDIDHITASIAAPQVPILCEPDDIKRNPANEYQGIFSLYHTVATAIAKGRMTLAETGDSLLDDPVIAALRQRIDYQIDPDSHYPSSYSGGLKIRLKNGKEIERYEAHNPGSRERPLPADQITGKFRANARRVFKADRVEAIEQAVMSLDSSGSPSAISTLLGAP